MQKIFKYWEFQRVPCDGQVQYCTHVPPELLCSQCSLTHTLAIYISLARSLPFQTCAAWVDRVAVKANDAFVWARGVPARFGDRVWKLAYYGWIPALLLIGVATSRTPEGKHPSLAAAILPPS